MYLDANFFILALLDPEEKGDRARGLQKAIFNGKKAITSSLTLDEIMWVLIRNKKKDLLREVVLDIYSMPNLTVRDVTSLIPLNALEFMEKFELKPRDAFHVAIMAENNVKEIVSDDSDFDHVDGIRRIKL